MTNDPQSAIRQPRFRIAIAGAGPAGASLAIRLAQRGVETTLIERETFPRDKLCGEFLSPECLTQFEELGIRDRMLSAGGDRILETRFYEIGGRSISVSNEWFGGGRFALSLSRAEMDLQLLERAKQLGVHVFENTTVNGVDIDGGRIGRLRARRADGSSMTFDADLFVDATGRGQILSRSVAKQNGINTRTAKPAHIGFKRHLTNVALEPGVCEIYSFEGGYAGLSNVENGLANLCFLLRSDTARAFNSDADSIVETALKKNRRAAAVIDGSRPASDWLAVAIDRFGVKIDQGLPNLLSIGDAAAFIDPFTGSGMMMAMQSAKLLAETIVTNAENLQWIATEYADAFKVRFGDRLKFSSIIRRTAFMPRLATAVVLALKLSSSARRFVALKTRQ